MRPFSGINFFSSMAMPYLSHSLTHDNDVELELLKDKWKGDVTITRALFEHDNPEAPLSWHLTRADKEEIDEQWMAELNRFYNTCAGWDRVRSFLTDQKATNGP